MSKLSDRLLALLFITAEPVTAASVATALEVPEEDVAACLEAPANELEAGPLRLSRHPDRSRLDPAPQLRDEVRRFRTREVQTASSRPALQPLALIA